MTFFLFGDPIISVCCSCFKNVRAPPLCAAPANVLKCSYHMGKCSAPTQRGILISKSTTRYTVHLVP